MDGELFTDSHHDADGASGFNCLSETTKTKGKRGRKRKLNQQNGAKKKPDSSEHSSFSDVKKVDAQSATTLSEPECEMKENVRDDRKRNKTRYSKKTYNKRPFSHHVSSGNGKNKDINYPDVFQEARNQNQLAVCCGKMTGCLYKEKYNNGGRCILSKGKWFTPREFEMFSGKANFKKWTNSIYYKTSDDLHKVTLMKLIQNGCLSKFPRQLRESIEQTDRDDANSLQILTSNEFLNCNGFPESWKRLFSKTLEVSLLRNENNTPQKETTEQDSSSDESVSVAERVKMNRRESMNSAETLSRMITEEEEPVADERDGTVIPAAAPEPDFSVLEEADVRDEGDETSFSAPPAEWQNPVDPEETQTGQAQLLSFLADQFHSLHNTLKSIDSSLKKLLEKPECVRKTRAVLENSQIHCLVKEERNTELVEK